MHAPVMKRMAITATEVGSTRRIAALATEATAAEPMKKRRGSRRSASASPALTRVPATNPA